MRTALLALLVAAHVHAADFRLDREVESLLGTHRHYTQYIDGIPVDGAARVESVMGTRGGGLQPVPARAEARAHVLEAVAFSSNASIPDVPAPTKDATLVYLNLDGNGRLAWRYVTNDYFAHWIDAHSGEALRTEQLFWTASARVFDINPVSKLNDPTLRDRNNSADAVPDAAYDVVELPDLNLRGPLGGPNAVIVDAEGPPNTPVDVSQSLLFDRSQSGFEDVNAYFQVDRSLRYIQSLGFTGARRIIAYPIPIDPHAAGGADNSYYIPSAIAGRGTLFFGEGGTDDAEDADLMLHELGHAIQDWIAPGTFGGLSSSESRAMGEGFGDYWAFSSTYDATVRAGRDPFCIADWDARCAGDDSSQQCGYAEGADCLRRVDGTKTMAEFIRAETAGTEHKNGEIWSSALREIFLGIGKRKTDTIVLESFFGVGPNPTFEGMAKRMVDADRALFDGADLKPICIAMQKRGISDACAFYLPRGETTWLASADRAIPIPDGNPTGITSTLVVTDPRTLANLGVYVDIQHPARGDLRIVLTAPDGTQVLLQDSSLDRTADIRGTFGVDILPAQSLNAFAGRSANGTWKLTVSDVLARDSGTLLSWALVAQFEGDAALANRPAAAASSRFLPVVSSLRGAAGSQWASDVHILNRGLAAEAVTLVFTPGGADGTQTFAAIRTVVPAGEVVAFRDVVAQLFRTTGSGTLEVVSDTNRLLVWSDTYDATRGVGQSVRSVAKTDAIFRGQSVFLTRDRTRRMNVGAAEIAGASGVVRVRIVSPAGFVAFDQEVAIAPYGQFQLPVPTLQDVTSSANFIAIDVVSGDAGIVAYGSYVDSHSGDPVFIRAERPTARRVAIPAIDADGAYGRRWTSSLDSVNVLANGAPASVTFQPLGVQQTISGAVSAPRYLPLLLQNATPNPFGYLELDLPEGGVVASNVTTTIGDRVYGEHLEAIPIANALGKGDAADVVNVTNDASVRTNYGLMEVGGGTATVEVRLLSTRGVELARTTLTLGPRQIVQLPVTQSVVDGVLDFRVIDGDGRVLAYASIIDNETNDFFFLSGE
ncbi:MAG: proprotein convertase P-domain-containing protein [Acidobacteria bacterium]|nr:proprotein convertase P-domain-containing protein [Acidobacteriota bacterium]